MNLLYHFDTEPHLRDFGDHCVPVSMCPFGSKQGGEVWAERDWQDFYQADINAALDAIKAHPLFVFAEKTVTRYKQKYGYFNPLASIQTTMLNEPVSTYQKVTELLNIVNRGGDNGEWYIIHNLSVVTYNLSRRRFYLVLDLEHIMPGTYYNLNTLYRQKQIDELLKTL